MDSVPDPASTVLRRSTGALVTALHAKEPRLVSTTILDLRRALHEAARDADDARAHLRLTQLSQGLRQIDRAARDGDFADAHRVLALWTRGT